jgi:(R,R)-butanediol dehydrogenase / meso-butanediol dehydrogenase / diacetyl reductase
MIVDAAVYTGARTVRIEGVPSVAPGPGEAQIEVAYTGICGTDLHVFRGDMDVRVGRRAVLGHEMSGHVVALGAGVQGWSVGDHVTVMAVQWCGECPACQAGNRHICLRLRFLGIDAAGSMQGGWTVPAGTLVRIPPEVPLPEAALVEPVAVAGTASSSVNSPSSAARLYTPGRLRAGRHQPQTIDIRRHTTYVI